jgi:uncharacterized protein (DUF2384 family)
MIVQLAPDTQSDAGREAQVVTKAAARAADRLGLKNNVLCRIIGLSEPTISRMRKGRYVIDPGHKSFELALLFVRLYRSLDAVTGGDESVAADWLANGNTALNGKPIDLIQTVSGLISVIAYLDSRRAVV